MVAWAAIRTSLLTLALVLATAGSVATFEPSSLVGAKASEFAMRDMAGSYVSITAMRGKVIVLNFWATWCPPCKVEMPGLEQLYHDYRAGGLEVIGLSTDSSEAGIREFLSKTPVNFPILHDRSGRVTKLYGVNSLPTTFLIDRSGTVVELFIGEQDWTSPHMRDRIESLLKRASGAPGKPGAVPVFFQKHKSL